jgi:hypothetical protein
VRARGRNKEKRESRDDLDFLNMNMIARRSLLSLT